jgi:flavin reductase (DIM6/NTAB) family NADH-FMN oxidoreductase RutF
VVSFQEAVGELDYPMFIVTVLAEGEMSGCLVGFASQCSIDPFRFLVCISKKNRTFDVAQRSECMAVHIVPGAQWELARLFGEATGDDVDKFARCAWSSGPGGVPVLELCPTWFAGPITERVDTGDHLVHVLEPSAGRGQTGVAPLSFQRARKIDPGHEA